MLCIFLDLFISFDELQPYHWTNVFDNIVMYDDEHE